jgi:DNA ligase-1
MPGVRSLRNGRHDEIQRSPQYASGFALRFARIARIRDDKDPVAISSLAELQALYDRQFAATSRGREP